MTNPQKGEVSFEAGGKAYTLKLGTNAMAMVEERMQTTWAKFMARPEADWTVRDSVVLLWAGLHRHHAMTEEAVGDLIDEIGDQLAPLLMKAFGLANPGTGANGTARPPVPPHKPRKKRGTGTGS